MTTIKNLFFGTILATSSGITAAGLINEWYAYAIMIPAGAILGWKLAEWV
jgi:hypothetical protein